MVETSGRDIAMFRYIDHFFPDEQYRKLVRRHRPYLCYIRYISYHFFPEEQYRQLVRAPHHRL